MIRSAIFLAIATSIICSHPSLGDDLLYHYEGDVLPSDPSTTWQISHICKDGCSEYVLNGHFVFHWILASELAGYSLPIVRPPTVPPASLWVEWNYRSNHSIGPFFDTCDGTFYVQFRKVFDYIDMFGDFTLSSGGSGYVSDLSLNDFHTYRFESLKGETYTFAVDGLIFVQSAGTTSNGFSSLLFTSRGLCPGDTIQEVINEWDFIRYGTIDSGEQMVASVPPAGFVDARLHPALDRFTIKYDSPNYVYLNEITVEVLPNQYRDREGAVLDSDPATRLDDSIDNRQSQIDNPVVVATRRLDNGPPDVVEIVLDRPIPHNAATRFTFDDGTLAQAIQFTYAPGDTDGNGQATLSDLAAFQNCFGSTTLTSLCPVLDSNNDGEIDLSDFASIPW